MKIAGYLLFTAGVLALIALVGYYGATEIGTAVLHVGWGLVVVSAFHLIPMAADTLAWKVLINDRRPVKFLDLLWIRWIRESVSTLLPVSQVGGDLVRLRLAIQRGIKGSIAGASIVVDLTISLFALVVFCLVGAALLLKRGVTDNAFVILSLAVVVSFAIVIAFYALQRFGLFNTLLRMLMRMMQAQNWTQLTGGAAALDAAIHCTYERRRDVLVSSVWAFIGWLLGAGEVWLALYFLGASVSFAEALIVESLIQGIRNAAFVVPSAVGVQEGGLVLLGAMIGLSPDIAIALSLVKRVRELALGVPGLLSWHFSESRRLLQKANGNTIK
ncbi:MAG: flippase-like domain-containing protein [Burkholderiaceae bacterium]